MYFTSDFVIKRHGVSECVCECICVYKCRGEGTRVGTRSVRTYLTLRPEAAHTETHSFGPVRFPLKRLTFPPEG